MRAHKNKYLIDTMPSKVKNYILLSYEDLCSNFETIFKTMQTRFNLKAKHEQFVNFSIYTPGFKAKMKNVDEVYVPKPNNFTYEDIIKMADTNNVTFVQADDSPFSTSTAISLNKTPELIHTDLNSKCKSENCIYKVHTDFNNNGGIYCCRICQLKKGHGPLCEKVVFPL